MSKIAFFVQWMLCGGVESTLISLSKELAKRGNEVTIYVIVEKGEFIKKIPNEVMLKKIPMDENVRSILPVGGIKQSIRESILEKKYNYTARYIINYLSRKNEFAELRIPVNKIPQLDINYDIAVNYHMHSPFLVWYLSERVKARKKFTWIHNDFETTNYNIRGLKNYLNCVDKFFCVAQNLVDEFSLCMPEYKEKIYLALNIVPTQEIVEKANDLYPKEFSMVPESCIKILTVGRLEEQKGYDIALDVCQKLAKADVKFKWFILGNGTQYNWIQDEIKRRNLTKYMSLLGVRMNPYPYFKNCDIYVQTSKHEGYVTTVSEAKIFCRPIVCTDVSGAKEQLRAGITGEVVEINADKVYEKVLVLATSKKIRNKYISELAKENHDQLPTWLSVFEEK